MGDDPIAFPPRSGEGKKLILSSPNSDALRRLSEDSSYKKLFMPLWDLKELLAAQDKCFPNLTPKYVEEQFEIYGGVPRLVLELSASDADAKLQQQVRELKMETLFDIMSKKTYTDLPSSKFTSVLIHVVPDPSFLEFKCAFASEIISRMLVDRFLNNSDFSMQQFVTGD